MKKLVILLLLIPLISAAQFKDLIKKATDKAASVSGTSSGLDIAAGLKEALNKGVTEQVSKLTKADGFYKNEAVKILMPDELVKVDQALRKIGMSSLADDGIKALNRAAEDAVKEATPIFVSAIRNPFFLNSSVICLSSFFAVKPLKILLVSSKTPLSVKVLNGGILFLCPIS